MKIVHIITRLILGGAQENTLLSIEGQQDDWGDDVTLITGAWFGSTPNSPSEPGTTT